MIKRVRHDRACAWRVTKRINGKRVRILMLRDQRWIRRTGMVRRNKGQGTFGQSIRRIIIGRLLCDGARAFEGEEGDEREENSDTDAKKLVLDADDEDDEDE